MNGSGHLCNFAPWYMGKITLIPWPVLPLGYWLNPTPLDDVRWCMHGHLYCNNPISIYCFRSSQLSFWTFDWYYYGKMVGLTPKTIWQNNSDSVSGPRFTRTKGQILNVKDRKTCKLIPYSMTLPAAHFQGLSKMITLCTGLPRSLPNSDQCQSIPINIQALIPMLINADQCQSSPLNVNHRHWLTLRGIDRH